MLAHRINNARCFGQISCPTGIGIGKIKTRVVAHEAKKILHAAGKF